MKQYLVAEVQEGKYMFELNKKLQEGFKVVAGSTFIKSLPTDIDSTHGTLLYDVEHAFSVAVRGNNDSVIFAKNFISFVTEVNRIIGTDKFNLVTGSMSIDLVQLDDYIECQRTRVTYYCCCLYKE